MSVAPNNSESLLYQIMQAYFLPRGATTSTDISATSGLMQLPPPPFPIPKDVSASGTSPDAAAVQKCMESCYGLPTVQYGACVATCQSSGKTPQEAFKVPGLTDITEKFGSFVVIIAAALLIIVAIALLTR